MYTSQGGLQVGISLVLMEYNKGNHDLARYHNFVTEKVGLLLTKCIYKNSNNPISFYYNFNKVQIDQSSNVCSYICHLKPNNEKI